MLRPAQLSPAEVAHLKGRRILVTGATGSFGRHFIETLLREAEVGRLVIFSRDELKQYEMQQDLVPLDTRSVLRFFIGDVRDQGRLELALRRIDTVIHAAALKQVPAAEYNPFECIHTNVLGAENVVRACLRTGVERVIALSTDKAANPANLYGASKLASDKIFVAANALAGSDGPRFSVVRYGNVLGSRGSVVPLFQRMIEAGSDHLPITDERMTRFWITLPQGVAFVCSCLEMMKGGEIFVPKIPSMRMTELAHAMAPKVPQRMVGIRPGEKLHEVMITEDDSRNTVELADRYIIAPAFGGRIRGHWHANGKPVAEGFRFASDTNPDWLTGPQLKALLAQ